MLIVFGFPGIVVALMEARTKGSVVEFPEQICDSALRLHKLVRLFAKMERGVCKILGTNIVMETLFMVPLIVVLKTPRTLNKGRHTNATVEFTNGGGPVELPQSRAPVSRIPRKFGANLLKVNKQARGEAPSNSEAVRGGAGDLKSTIQEAKKIADWDVAGKSEQGIRVKEWCRED
nr:hypothetical protein Iba_chr09fCG8810 [Ipomoea batatas]